MHSMSRTRIKTACATVASTVCIAFAAWPLRAQVLHATGPLPSFEVATVKPWQRPVVPPPPPPPPPGANMPAHPVPARIAPGRGGAQTSDHVHMILTARELIGYAYDLPLGFESRVLNLPAWANSDDFEVQAKIDDAQFAALQKLSPYDQRTQMKLMSQSLLVDRFHLQVHFEKRDVSAFELIVAKGGPKLTPASPDEKPMLSEGNNTIRARAITLSQFIHSPFLGSREIVDRTGLTGAYDFTLTYSQPTNPEDTGAGDLPSLFTAVQQQLGLRLDPTRAPVEFILIDHIERPSEN